MDKEIRFIDSHYNDLFQLPDGGNIQLTHQDGETMIRPCKYIDETHTQVGNSVFHICEFAERMEENGTRYAPAEPQEVVAGYTVTDKSVVGKKTFVLAHNPDAVQPYVTWQGHAEKPGYDWGHYFSSRSDAHGDYIRRAHEERRDQRADLSPKGNVR